MMRLESRPQGAQFTGRVDPDVKAIWAAYTTESGRKLWRCVQVGGHTTWWEEK